MNDHVEAAIYIVGDDGPFFEAAHESLAAAGYRVIFQADAECMLACRNIKQPGCVVSEIHLNGMSGLAFQKELKRRAPDFPLIFVTSHASVASAVAAMRGGAADYLEKPVGADVLLAAIEKALKVERLRRREHEKKLAVAASLDKLTSRELEIMRFVIAGKMNKTIADELCISIKTVEAHRARVMQKAGVDSVAALVRLALQTETFAHLR
ncbi:MAG: fixJ2 [Betaproteobacteria bacterium]|nr:fixJ2 [Betaproteobacteria bacterium]